MKALEDYLSGEFAATEQQLDKVHRAILGIGRLLLNSFRAKGAIAIWPYAGWPYEWGAEDPDNYFQKLSGKFSISTQAMCLVAVTRLLEYWDAHEPDNFADLILKLKRSSEECFSTVWDEIEDNSGWTSSTFGDKDIFTAAWVVEISSDKTPRDIVLLLTEIVAGGFPPDLENFFASDKTLLPGPRDKPNTAGPHALPLLRLVRAARSLIAKHSTILDAHRLDDNGKGKWALKDLGSNGLSIEDVFLRGLEVAGRWFQKTLDRQLTFERFNDPRFDAAELAFCLAGAVETGKVGPDERVLVDVLDVVERAQERSVYWRPYRPMITTPQGMVLLPLSVEVANALLGVTRPRGLRQNTSLFSRYRDVFDAYFHWLYSRRYSRASDEATEAHDWLGWHSENAYEISRVHIWTTSQVALFLIDYSQALAVDRQTTLLAKAELNVKWPTELKIQWSELISFDVGAPDDIKSQIERRFIEPRRIRDRTARATAPVSMLLGGPPGTSKTTLGEALAKELDWPLVYITPSDFLKRGEQMVEAAASLLFRILTSLNEVVIFFDEIDRLILDRDSDAYGKQGDLFQFMTPSMLAKLNDLAQARRSVFIIATNYAERIDKAIKRAGRIDQHFLCLPYNLKARQVAIRKCVGKILANAGPGAPPLSSACNPAVLELAKATVLLTHAELDGLIKKTFGGFLLKDERDIINGLEQAKDRVRRLVRSISDRDVQKRIADSDIVQKPFDEKLGLLLVVAEVDPTDEQMMTVQEAWRNLVGAVEAENIQANREYFERWIRAFIPSWNPDDILPVETA